MNVNLSPTELEMIARQLWAALETFQKRSQTQRKVSDEQLHCLTVADVAQRLKCHEKTVSKYIEDGRLRAANLGTFERPTWRISEADFSAFYVAHRTGK